MLLEIIPSFAMQSEVFGTIGDNRFRNGEAVGDRENYRGW